MKLNFGNYFQELGGVISNILVSGLGGRKIDLDNAMEKLIKRLLNNKKAGKKVVIVGNGGSSTIANHMAVDLWKNGGLKAISFSDSALLTCVSNDFGYQHVFEKPITMFADKGDTLIAISSSGKSENIVRAVSAAKKKGCHIVTMSGFDSRNRLRSLGEINFYVPSKLYGYVELVHSALCHFLIDRITGKNSNG